MEKIGILGYGEVGRAVAKFYKNPKIKDRKRDDNLAGVDVLHICIPYTSNFIKIVRGEIKKNAPGLTIIHSTVPIGTTKEIGGMVVHSPIRGVHPKMHKSIKTFVKYIGWDYNLAGGRAQEHFKNLGIKTEIIFNTRNTEALKLWSTTQYGLFITLEKEIYKFCEKNDLDFDVVYTSANRTYNEGYLKLNMPDVIRPELTHVPGKIGGSCVVPNCRMLDSKISKFILDNNRK